MRAYVRTRSGQLPRTPASSPGPSPLAWIPHHYSHPPQTASPHAPPPPRSPDAIPPLGPPSTEETAREAPRPTRDPLARLSHQTSPPHAHRPAHAVWKRRHIPPCQTLSGFAAL